MPTPKNNQIMTKKPMTHSWTNNKYPQMKGWTRTKHTRGPNDKNAGQHYYTYQPPHGVRKHLRSLRQVNARMESDTLAMKAKKTKNTKNNTDDKDVVIVTPKKPDPMVIDLTLEDDDEEEVEVAKIPSTTTIAVYGNVTMHLTPGGGYHIKWNE